MPWRSSWSLSRRLSIRANFSRPQRAQEAPFLLGFLVWGFYGVFRVCFISSLLRPCLRVLSEGSKRVLMVQDLRVLCSGLVGSGPRVLL